MPRRKRKEKTRSKPTSSPAEDAQFAQKQRENAEALGESAQQVMGKLPSLSRATSVLMLLVGILIVGLLFYKVMVGFFVPLFMAAAMAVIFRPIDQWILRRLNGRRRVAAIATTLLVLSIVLVPIAMIVSIAVGQLTGAVSRVNLADVPELLDGARSKLGLRLEYPDRFRRLDDLAGMLNEIEDPESVAKQVDEALSLIVFLDTEVETATSKIDSTENAQARLAQFSEAIDQWTAIQNVETADIAEKIAVEEKFHRASVVASAAINDWMNSKLGGSFRTQLKLLTNPSEKELAASFRSVREFVQPRLAKVTGDTGILLAKFLFGMFIMVISIYFFLVDGPSMIRTLMRLSPLDDEYELRLLMQFENTSRAVVLASVLAALAQGVLAAIAFYYAGLPSVVLLFFVTTIMSMVPFLGAGSVWIPCAIYLGFIEQRYTVAILFTIYCAAIVATIDNVIKAYVLHGHSELHPLVALLSVLGGLSVFGPIGLLIGPMVVVFLQTLLEILNSELAPDEEKASEPKDSEPSEAPEIATS